MKNIIFFVARPEHRVLLFNTKPVTLCHIIPNNVKYDLCDRYWVNLGDILIQFVIFGQSKLFYSFLLKKNIINVSTIHIFSMLVLIIFQAVR